MILDKEQSLYGAAVILKVTGIPLPFGVQVPAGGFFLDGKGVRIVIDPKADIEYSIEQLSNRSDIYALPGKNQIAIRFDRIVDVVQELFLAEKEACLEQVRIASEALSLAQIKLTTACEKLNRYQGLDSTGQGLAGKIAKAARETILNMGQYMDTITIGDGNLDQWAHGYAITPGGFFEKGIGRLFYDAISKSFAFQYQDQLVGAWITCAPGDTVTLRGGGNTDFYIRLKIDNLPTSKENKSCLLLFGNSHGPIKIIEQEPDTKVMNGGYVQDPDPDQCPVRQCGIPCAASPPSTACTWCKKQLYMIWTPNNAT